MNDSNGKAQTAQNPSMARSIGRRRKVTETVGRLGRRRSDGLKIDLANILVSKTTCRDICEVAAEWIVGVAVML